MAHTIVDNIYKNMTDEKFEEISRMFPPGTIFSNDYGAVNQTVESLHYYGYNNGMITALCEGQKWTIYDENDGYLATIVGKQIHELW
jgi:hypothetical protein